MSKDVRDGLDARVQLVRANEKVGYGTCTSIDECYSDAELIELFNENDITDAGEAVELCLSLEGHRIEQALNCRLGNDDDPELKAYEEWNR